MYTIALIWVALQKIAKLDPLEIQLQEDWKAFKEYLGFGHLVLYWKHHADPLNKDDESDTANDTMHHHNTT